MKHRIARLEPRLTYPMDHWTIFTRYNETGVTPTDEREFKMLIEFQALLIGMAQGHIREDDFNIWPGVRLFYERKVFFQIREFEELDADILSDGTHILRNDGRVVYCERPGFPGALPTGEACHLSRVRGTLFT